MSQATNANSANEEAPKNNILANELKSETDNPGTPTDSSTHDSHHADGSNHKEKAPKNNILANELKSETDNASTTTD